MTGKTTYSVEAVFKAIDHITKPVKDMEGAVQGLLTRRKALSGMIGGISKNFSSGIERAGRRAFTGAAVGAAVLGAELLDITKTGADYQRSLVKAAAKMPGTIRKGTEAYKELDKAARAVGRGTEFKASEAAAGLEFLAMAGFDAKQAISALPQVVDLATATSMDFAKATDIATDTMNAAGLATLDAAQLGLNLARVNDVIVGSTNAANFNVEQFYEAMDAGLSTVVGAGAQIEDFAGLLGMLANAGKKGSEAGTVIRNMFLRLQAPTGAAADMIKKYAGDLDDGTGKMIPFAEVIGRLQKSMGGLGKMKQAEILNEIFGLRAIGGAQVLLGTGETTIANFIEQLNNVKGKGAEIAAVIRGDAKASIDNLGSAVESLKLSIFELEGTAIQGAIDAATEWVRANEQLIAQNLADTVNWIRENFDMLVTTIKNVILIGAGLWALAEIATVVSTVMSVVATLQAMSAAALVSLGWVALIVAALVAAVALIVVYWEPISGFFKSVWEGVVAAWEWGVGVAEGIIDYLVHNGPISWILFAVSMLGEAMDALGVTWGDVWDGIVSAADAAFSFLLSATGIQGLIDSIKGLGPLWDEVSAAASRFWDAIVAGVQPAITWVKNFISPITNLYDRIIGYKNKVIDKQLFGGGFASGKDGGGEIVSRETRAAINTAELYDLRGGADITIRDETRRAQVDRSKPGTNMTLIQTGAF